MDLIVFDTIEVIQYYFYFYEKVTDKPVRNQLKI